MIKLKTNMQRLEEKMFDMESENKILRQQSLRMLMLSFIVWQKTLASIRESLWLHSQFTSVSSIGNHLKRRASVFDRLIQIIGSAIK
ncbi:hypothetical protein SOVF_149130 isoform A, partial [Spinacia oleracea]